MSFGKSILLFFLLHSFTFVQAQNSFYLNHGSLNECRFTNDAIYFLTNSNIVDKTDYYGNTIWSKNTGHYSRNLTLSDDAIYYFTDQTLVKLDTSGNFVWGKDLSVPQCGGIDIFLRGLVVNDSHVYVSTNGGYWGPSGMLAYDTAGNLLNQWCDQTGNDNFIIRGFPRVSGGAWFTFFDVGTSLSYTWLVGVDSLGNIAPNVNAIDLDGGLSQNVVDVIYMPDSTYLSININHSEWMIWAPVDFHFDITNFTKDGIVVWKRSYFSHTEELFLGASGIDNIGNIYLIGEKTNDTTSSQFSLKLDPYGNIIQSNEWLNVPSSFTYPNYSRMKYNNGFLYCPFTQYSTSGVYIMDTSMTPPCGIIRSPYVFDTMNTSINYPQWYNYTSVTYVNISASINISPHVYSTTNDLCLVLSNYDYYQENIFNVMPNPSHDYIRISSGATTANIEIFNSLGNLCVQKSVLRFPETVDIRDLKPGIYFLKFQTKSESAVKKIIIE